MRRISLLILMVAGIATMASGHSLYAEFPQEISANSEIDVWITYGHCNGEKEDFDLSAAQVVSPDGDINELTLEEYQDGLRGKVDIGKPGCYILDFQKDASFFDPKWYGVSGDKELTLNYARAMMTAESGDNYDWTSGDGLEIVPLVDPYNLEVGDEFRAKVLWNGELLDGYYNAVVAKTPSDLLTIQHAEECEVEGDSEDGVISFELTRPGLWVITVFADSVEESGTWTATSDQESGYYNQDDELEYDAIAPTAYLTLWCS
jgi:cobalt/nickel transport protein